MTIERVRITPNQMVLRSATGAIKFDTNNQYVRTNANGNLRLNQQLSSVYFGSSFDSVKTAQVAGVCLVTFSLSSIANGAQFSLRYPEFSGRLGLVTSAYNGMYGGQPQGGGFAEIQFRINGNLTSSPRIKWYVNFARGGFAAIEALGEIPYLVNPGDLITVGGISTFDNAGTPVSSSASGFPSSNTIVAALYAYEADSSLLPLSVTA